MIQDSLIKHLGDTLVHVTAASNVPLIMEHGLMPAAKLADMAGVTADRITLRNVRRKIAPPFGLCILNHQKPIVEAGDSPNRMLDGYTPTQWAAQLDTRVYFAPRKMLGDFKKSLAKDLPMAEIEVATADLLDACDSLVDLAPINTGNFRQGGANAERGDWIYVPATDGIATFRQNRVKRGLVASSDSVKEVSVRGTVPAAILKERITA